MTQETKRRGGVHEQAEMRRGPHLAEVEPPWRTDDEPGLADYVQIALEGRWLIAAAAAMGLAVGVVYTLVAPPRWRADILVQVEKKQDGLGALDELSTMLSGDTPAETEMEILRSRQLVGSVVEQLRLDVVARPRTLPLVGDAVFRRHRGDELADPVLGLDRFAWGGERIALDRLDVPEALLGEELRLVSGPGGSYDLLDRDGALLIRGHVGSVAQAQVAMEGRRATQEVAVFVSELRARPGTEFRVARLPLADVIAGVQQQLQIGEKGKKTGILQVALEGSDRAELATVLDAVANTYVRQNVERKSAQAEKTLQFLEAQLPQLKAELDAAEAELERYRTRAGRADITAETQAMLTRAGELAKANSELQVQEAELRERFTQNHPTISALREKFARLDAEKKSLDERLKSLPATEMESARRLRDVTVANELYVVLLNRTQELKVVKSGTVGNVRILDRPLVPRKPVSPKKGAALAISLALGLGLGIALALVKRSLSRGVEDPEIVERELGLSVYASVPHSDREERSAALAAKGHDRGSVLAAQDASDLAIESLRSLRTSLQFALMEAGRGVIAVLGPVPGIGKTFVAANLACVLAEGGKRVVLVDADLRKGRLHKLFGRARGGGLGEAIRGDAELSSVIRTSTVPRLDYVTTGEYPANPAELLASERFERIIAELSSRYDLVVIDTPPVLAVTDAALVGRLAGVNLLVLRAGKHPLREINWAVKRLEQSAVRVHGVVMNGVQPGIGYRKYYYHYEYAKKD